MTEVQFISAPWCGRCKTMRPAVEEVCRLAGARFEYVNLDELADDDPVRVAVKALPSMRTRLRNSVEWVIWVPADFDKWKETILNIATAAAVGCEDF